MKTFTTTAMAALFCFIAWSQGEKKPTQISESIYIMPVEGKAAAFEVAIATHNKKFHPVGPHHAMLRRVDYGAKAGWYVWVMKGTFASLDSRPDKGGHDEDWDANVNPTVKEYGDSGLWSFDEDMSYGMDTFQKSSKYNVWSIDIKRGQGERFNNLTKKISDTFESMGNRAFLVYNNQVHTPGGADVAFIWSMKNFADLDTEWGTEAAYEKLHGTESWKKMLTEWYDITVDHTEEIRTML